MKNNKDTTNGIMIISIYQIIPELDTDHIKYMDLDFMQRHGYKNLPADIYKCVYHGEVPVQDLSEVYRMFNRVTESDVQYLEQIGFYSHSLSVSEVVEIHTSPSESHFYFCDFIGFREVEFQKEAVISKYVIHE